MKTERLRRDRTEIITYLVLWAVLFAAPLLGEYIQSTHEASFNFEWHLVCDIWTVFELYLVAFLIHNFLIAPTLIYHHKPGRYLACVALLLVCFTIVQCSVRPDHPDHPRLERMEGFHRPPPNTQHPAPTTQREGDPVPPPRGLINGDGLHLLTLFLLLGLNLGVKLYFKNERDRKKMQQLKSQTLEQQLEHLRYQLNPHFFMNTLNNIHALIDINSEQAKQTIVDLSHLMRYVLYEGAKATVPLERDIAFMEDYIRLMKIRYADRVSIKATFETPPNTPLSSPRFPRGRNPKGEELPPMLFISFIENAFKHGVSYQKPSFIYISLQATDEQIVFNCRNSVHKKEGTGEPGGVGLRNVRQRLDLLYADRYTLDIQETEKEYCVTVKLIC